MASFVRIAQQPILERIPKVKWWLPSLTSIVSFNGGFRIKDATLEAMRHQLHPDSTLANTLPESIEMHII
ncbi:MAG: hypothetical protein GKR96_00110 [Gammaproteobacteria bacterium]|nr:hypothetical protein [Gammaproteobacteria bacterium]